jgi:hypothetical protein
VTDTRSIPTGELSSGQPHGGPRKRRWFLTRSGTNLYKAFDPPAQWVKAIVQMAVGLGTVITIGVLVCFPSMRSGGVAELALRVAAGGLALAAVVELTYTLFTEGPDEAIDPLILGVSSFILLKISDPGTDLTLSNAGAVALLVLTLGVLFLIRDRFIEKPKQDKAKAIPDSAHDDASASSPGHTSQSSIVTRDPELKAS